MPNRVAIMEIRKFHDSRGAAPHAAAVLGSFEKGGSRSVSEVAKYKINRPGFHDGGVDSSIRWRTERVCCSDLSYLR